MVALCKVECIANGEAVKRIITNQRQARLDEADAVVNLKLERAFFGSR